MERHDYYWARTSVIITGVVFVSQLCMEVGGIITRKPGLEWVIYACGGAFALALVYSAILIVLNARQSR